MILLIKKYWSRLINWLLTCAAVAFGVVFAMANREAVSVSLDPFSQSDPFFSLQAPLFMVIMTALLLGIVLGGIGGWLSAGRVRRVARQRKRENKKLEKELDAAAKEPAVPAIASAADTGASARQP